MLCGENVKNYMSIYVICICYMYDATVFVRFVMRWCVKRPLFVSPDVRVSISGRLQPTWRQANTMF